MEKYSVYYDSDVGDVGYEPHSEGSWYRAQDVEPILNSLQQLEKVLQAYYDPDVSEEDFLSLVAKLRRLSTIQQG